MWDEKCRPGPLARGTRAFCFSALVAIAVLTTLCRSAQPAAQTSTGAQPPSAGLTAVLPPGPAWEKATTACTECHEARIIVQQRLSKAAWTKEVDKMIKWGAVVDATDHDALIDYFSANFGPGQPPYEPPRSASAKGGNSRGETGKEKTGANH